MKKSFEHYVAIIENELEFKLFDWQKDVLIHIYNGELNRICFGRQYGLTMLSTAAIILYEEMERDNGELPPRQYELESHSTTVVTCDEDWGENIIWEKENQL